MNLAVKVETRGPTPHFQARDAPSPRGWAPSAADSCASQGAWLRGTPLLTSQARPKGTLTTLGRSPAIIQATALTLFGHLFGSALSVGKEGCRRWGAGEDRKAGKRGQGEAGGCRTDGEGQGGQAAETEAKCGCLVCLPHRAAVSAPARGSEAQAGHGNGQARYGVESRGHAKGVSLSRSRK